MDKRGQSQTGPSSVPDFYWHNNKCRLNYGLFETKASRFLFAHIRDCTQFQGGFTLLKI